MRRDLRDWTAFAEGSRVAHDHLISIREAIQPLLDAIGRDRRRGG